MSEENAPPPDSSLPPPDVAVSEPPAVPVPEEPKPKKDHKVKRDASGRRMKRICSPKMKKAFAAVYLAKQKTTRVGFKDYAEEFGVNIGTLREYWSLWQRGLLDWGPPQTQRELEITARVAHERQLKMLIRLQTVLIESAEDSVDSVNRARLAGKKAILEMRRGKVMDVLRMLKFVAEFRASTERGYLSALDDLSAELNQREKQALGTEVVATVENLTDEQKAIRVLRDAAEQGLTPAPDVEAEEEARQIEQEENGEPLCPAT